MSEKRPLKYYDIATTFSEVPDEITLAVNISDCPGGCSECSEPWLREYVGTLLTNEEIDKLISENEDITCFALMGGDSNHEDCLRVIKYIHENYKDIKVCMYSGREYFDLSIANEVDYYKIGRWIMPKGEVSKWHLTNNGVIKFPWSNQLMFKRIDNHLINITYMFRTEIYDTDAQRTKEIIMPEDNKDEEV